MGEALERKCLEVDAGIAADDQVRQNAAGGWRVLKAVTAEAVDEEEPTHSGDRSDDRVAVRRHLVQACPRMRNRRGLERRQALHGNLGDLRKKIPSNRRVERGRLARIAHSKQETGALAMEIEGCAEIDHHDV